MSQLSSQAALDLSNVLLDDLELNRLPLTNCFMKGCRLARLAGDVDLLQIFKYEISGYPSNMSNSERALARMANRQYQEKGKDGKLVNYIYRSSIENLEAERTSAEARLVNSSHMGETSAMRRSIASSSSKLAQRRALLYDNVLKKHMELRISSPAEDIFASYRQEVDELLSQFIPKELTKIDSISDNLNSENPEDWANAAHTCRRLLQALADKIFPPTADRIIGEGKRAKTTKLGPDNYINRLIAFCEDNSSSSVFENLLGSHLSFTGHRLDAIFKGAQKGSHATVKLDEAKRIVIFSYLCVGDILKLSVQSEADIKAVIKADTIAD